MPIMIVIDWFLVLLSHLQSTAHSWSLAAKTSSIVWAVLLVIYFLYTMIRTASPPMTFSRLAVMMSVVSFLAMLVYLSVDVTYHFVNDTNPD